VAPTVVYSAPIPVVPYPPTVVYRPALVAPPPVVAYYYARPVIVRPKVYVPGQPVRNFLRAITP
jgi:hypothetical protein